MKWLPLFLALIVLVRTELMAQKTAPEPTPKEGAKPTGKPTKSALEQAKDLTPDEAEKLIASKPGLIILDVRSDVEFDQAHIKGAVNVDVNDEGFAAKLAALDQTKPVLVHCAAGLRSTRALKEMQVKFPEIYHLKTGIKGWSEAKKPLETKQPAATDKK